MVRILPALAVLVFAIVVTWNLARRTATPPPQPLEPTATTLSTPTIAAAHKSETEISNPNPLHRLAGTVVGDLLYAIIEAPDGTNDLYGIDEVVPDLGKLVAVGEKSATFEGHNGRFEMKLLAAPKPTAVPTAAESAPEDVEEYEDEELDRLYEDGFDEDGLDAAPSDDSRSDRPD